MLFKNSLVCAIKPKNGKFVQLWKTFHADFHVKERLSDDDMKNIIIYAKRDNSEADLIKNKFLLPESVRFSFLLKSVERKVVPKLLSATTL